MSRDLPPLAPAQAEALRFLEVAAGFQVIDEPSPGTVLHRLQQLDAHHAAGDITDEQFQSAVTTRSHDSGSHTSVLIRRGLRLTP